MIEVQLTYNLYHSWKTQNAVSVIGYAFYNKELLKENTLITFFEGCITEALFANRLKSISGHFAVVIKYENIVFAAVDLIRTFPLFFYHEQHGIFVTDDIHTEIVFNKTQIENFKKVYCTLENDTLLNGWKQLQAGEYVVFDKTGFTPKIKSYYHHSKPTDKKNDSVRLKVLENELIERTLHYANNRTLLLPLSGGYDSRYLLALLKPHYDKIECFTYGKKNSYEVLIAKNVCEKLNVKWHFIEYTNELLDVFFTDEWQEYSTRNHHFSSLPHEQDFFALYFLKQNNLLPKDALIVNGFCQDIHAGSFIEPVRNFDLQKFIYHKHQLQTNVVPYENSWNGYQEWLVKNRLSKFIINSVHVYEYFGLDFYLPFWNKEWIDFWYGVDMEERLDQKFYNNYLFSGIFKEYKVDFKKPSHDTTNRLYSLKRIVKSVLPSMIIEQIQLQNSINKQNDVNNGLYLYERMYDQLNQKPERKDFRINNIHAVYFLEKLKEKYQI